MLVKVFPIKLKDGTQDKVEAIVAGVRAASGPGPRTAPCRSGCTGTRPSRITCCSSSTSPTRPPTTRTPARPPTRELIAGQFASLIVEFTEIDHELVAAC